MLLNVTIAHCVTVCVMMMNASTVSSTNSQQRARVSVELSLVLPPCYVVGAWGRRVISKEEGN